MQKPMGGRSDDDGSQDSVLRENTAPILDCNPMETTAGMGIGMSFYRLLTGRTQGTQALRGIFRVMTLACLGLCLAPWMSAQTAAPAPKTQQTVIGIDCEGNHRVPCQTIRTRIFTRVGDPYNPAQVDRDFMSLWNSQFFDDLRIEREVTPKGVLLHIIVQEKPLIRSIKYKGLKSITESDVMDRYKARNVRLTVDSPYDPTVVKHAEVAIKELLSEHGRQYSTVKAVTTPLPPSSVELTFNVDEGPKVQVGKINFTGNKVLSSRTLRQSMKQLRPIGIPDSLIFESLFSKTYDEAKLSQDLENVRSAYQDRGYFEALVENPALKLRNTKSMHILFWGGHPGKKVDITIPVVEGKKFKVGKITFLHNKFITNDTLLTNVFGMHQGEVLDVSKLRKGLENLRKLYGQFGYINFVANPDPQADEQKQVVNLTMDMEEGKPFYIHRIEFTGNTTTRDKVIRRELMVTEGGRFNNEAWKNSLLRLNQLGYFDEIKPEDADIQQDTTGPEGKVDITLHLKEKGKNTIGLTGGVSGLFGSFIGLNYSTNNFLGLGETLSVSTNYGQLQRNISFGFTEPYLFDRPIQLGFTVYSNSFHYDQAKEASIFYGQDVSAAFSGINSAYLLNYAQNSKGFTIGTSYPVKRSFTRLGLTYGYDSSNIVPFTQGASLLFNSISFQSISGPNSLHGIRTSSFTPSLTYNTVNSVYQPTGGKEIDLSAQIAGLGGNVKMIRPTFSYKYFHHGFKNHTWGFRVMGSIVDGYGGSKPPAFDRFFVGGEDDIRGFDIMAVTPIALIPTETTVNLLNPLSPDPTHPLTITVPNPTPGNPSGTVAQTFPVKIPMYQITTPGGDTEGIFNFEYRVPIVGPLTLAYFLDTGVNRISLPHQLQVANSVLNQLQTDFGRSFDKNIPLAPGTNSQVRMSTGLELQIMMPVIHAPFRVYYAINPLRVDTVINPPTLFTNGDFLKAVPAAFQNDALVQQSIAATEKFYRTQPGTPFKEAPHVLRFTISRTF